MIKLFNERDELGSDLVPDYLTSVEDGGFYGWPYSYWGGHVDRRVKPARPAEAHQREPPGVVAAAARHRPDRQDKRCRIEYPARP